MNIEVKSADDELKEARSKKEKISMLLDSNEDNRDWTSIKDHAPEYNVPVVVRIENENLIYGEDDKSIMYAEDIKIAVLLQGMNGCFDKWSICPPFMKYEYSPLTHYDQLVDGTVVTHWAVASEEEVESWKHRLDIMGDYKHLRIEVSGEYEELIYRAIINGANMIARSAGADLQSEGHELQAAMYATLTDLQGCIDHDSHVSNGVVIKNAHPQISDLDPAVEIYDHIRNKLNFETDNISRVISMLSVIDDDPEKYFQMYMNNKGADKEQKVDEEDHKNVDE